MAKTHHRKTWPFKPGWQKEVHVWPFLLRIEFLAAIIVTIILMVWSITLNAPLEEPANPNLTMNPAKAPWYFLGLQEMLVYFDPWIAGVVMPTLIIVGLMVDSLHRHQSRWAAAITPGSSASFRFRHFFSASSFCGSR